MSTKPRVRVWGSPIESQMRNALVNAVGAHRVCVIDYSTTTERVAGVLNLDIASRIKIEPSDPAVRVDLLEYGGEDWDVIAEMYSSVYVGPYKLDFLIVGDYAALAIECDGHEWHERTKQQAASDRARDRWFLIAGIPTVRFTGSEIHHDAELCATEAWRAFLRSEIDGRKSKNEQVECWDAGYGKASEETATSNIKHVRIGIAIGKYGLHRGIPPLMGILSGVV